MDDYAFGWIVPMFVIFILNDRWRIISKQAQDTESLKRSHFQASLDVGTFIVLHGALLLFAFGGVLRAVEGSSARAALAVTLGYAGFALGTCFLTSAYNTQGNRQPLTKRIIFTGFFLFPILIWLISSPLLPQAQNAIQLYLLDKVVAINAVIFDLLGLPIHREGNLLVFPGGSVGVTEACSGIRSLTACIFAGSFLAAVFMKNLTRKVLLLLTAVVLAFVTNVMRSLFLTSWAYVNGSESIEGTVHDVTGYAVLGITSVSLLVICVVVNKVEDFFETTEKKTSAV